MVRTVKKLVGDYGWSFRYVPLDRLTPLESVTKRTYRSALMADSDGKIQNVIQEPGIEPGTSGV